jgi:pimeloyl-ACP methyl ester carboxylesterase
MDTGDAGLTDPGLLKKFSTFQSYTVPGSYVYPSIRTFYRPHSQAAKLPTEPAPLPLLVFIHGLGGSIANWNPILTSLINVAPCLAIDLPGCGMSKFSPRDWQAYTTDALVKLLAVAIQKHLDSGNGQKIVLIGHSMGSSLCALLASSTSPYSNFVSQDVLGVIATCPKAEPPTGPDAAKLKQLTSIPTPIFNVLRRLDQRGGIESASIKRFAGPGADHQTKRLQLRFNRQSKTAVWRRMARGMIPVPGANSGLADGSVWSGLQIPLFLVAGEDDHVTPPDELLKIARFLGKNVPSISSRNSSMVPDTAAPISTSDTRDTTHENASPTKSDLESTLDSAFSDSPLDPFVRDYPITAQSSRAPQNTTLPPAAMSPAFKSTVLPSPAAHALIYATNTSRTLSGLIQGFLSSHIDERLSLGWQLQYLSTEGKWDVKNLQKWQKVQPVSEPISGVFRALKTLREVDPSHCPKKFVEEWSIRARGPGNGGLKAVIDISHESPVYDPAGLEAGGIEYHKFPTVSKLPPSVDEVQGFCALVDRLRGIDGDETHSHGRPQADADLIGVHCHYGYNRTGFFVVCYMVERLGWNLDKAIDEFKLRRHPGIRHQHFIDTLYVRYCVGLKRAPTL